MGRHQPSQKSFELNNLAPSESQRRENAASRSRRSLAPAVDLHIALPPPPAYPSRQPSAQSFDLHDDAAADLGQSKVDLETGSYALGYPSDQDFGEAKYPSPDANSVQYLVPPLHSATSSAAPQRPFAGSAGEDAAPLPPLKPSIALLYSLSTRKEMWLLVYPSVLCSIAVGLLQPWLTIIIGRAMNSYTSFYATGDKHKLMAEQLEIFITLLITAAVIVAAHAFQLMLWNVNAEHIARHLRLKVFAEITEKKLEWFDLGMGGSDISGDAAADKAEGAAANSGEGAKEEASSAAGLAGRFARDTDNVSTATGQTMGLSVENLSVAVFCLILSFYRSYKLTFVLLITFPLVIIATGVVEKITTPLVQINRSTTGDASAKVERTVAAIATVKAFNAEKPETKRFLDVARRMKDNYNKLSMLWGLRLGISQFFLLMSFVQGFWYGNVLVNKGELTSGAVTEVFWATFNASAAFQALIPYLNGIETGKQAMAGLLNLLRQQPRKEEAADIPSSPPQSATSAAFTIASTSPTTTKAPKSPGLSLSRGLSRHKRPGGASRIRNLRKIRPATFSGELALHHVTFHYPTRPHPHPPTLIDVSMFLPARETAFIVGQSGSGKSTIGSLLMNLYEAEFGRIEADEQGIEWLDEQWLRSHIGMVSQGAAVLFDGTVHDNVAIGAVAGLSEDPVKQAEQLKGVSRERVVEACRLALVHDFIRDLPDGYDTWLSGQKGASLSGGQRQRIAIARAFLRDPTVLILDEATSALDTTSRLLVFEAIKAWRKNRTTIVITHDLNPILPTDFVYVVKDGRVVEQGYRGDLDAAEGWFSQMAALQTGKTDGESAPAEKSLEEKDADFRRSMAVAEARKSLRMTAEPGSLAVMGTSLRSLMARSGYFGDSSSSYLPTAAPAEVPDYHPGHGRGEFINEMLFPPTRSSSREGLAKILADGHEEAGAFNKRYSDGAMLSLEHAGRITSSKRVGANRRDVTKMEKLEEEEVQDTAIEVESEPEDARPRPTLKKVLGRLVPAVPDKWVMMLGYFFCVVSGVSTPIFSVLMSNMITILGTGKGVSELLRTALLVFLVAACDGLGMWLKYSLLQRAAMNWVADLRERTFHRMLSQDKAWFDLPENSPMRLSIINVADVEDARNVIGMIAGQFLLVSVMLLLGLIWAMVVGWELTLIGLSVAPVMLIVLMWQTSFLGKREQIDKAHREDAASQFYQTVSNIRAIRAMAIESVFVTKFKQVVQTCHQSHVRTAFFTGTAYSVGQGMNTLAQALILYIGALLINAGRYQFGQMIQVLSLVLFSVTFAAQTMSYVPVLSKCVCAAADLLRLYDLPEDTQESRGTLEYPVQGSVSFKDVSFHYPTRPDVKVLDHISFRISTGECVGIVGASGCGKSTVASLIQRLYEPESGQVTLDGHSLSDTDVRFLRSHIAVVSQVPALFDMSVSENIAYGMEQCTQEEIEEAARQANAHDFVLGLPEGYNTNLGENASLISGGQAQRLQIARAIVRRREVLILDECTSALDPENQAIVMDTIKEVKEGRTTVVVTHKLDLMKTCDRLLVMDAGQVVETGTFEELVSRRGGHFATLAAAGEWAL